MPRYDVIITLVVESEQEKGEVQETFKILLDDCGDDQVRIETRNIKVIKQPDLDKQS